MNPQTGTRIATWVVVAALAVVVALVASGVSARSLLFLGAALICPVTMLFMHGGHGGHGGHGAGDPSHGIDVDENHARHLHTMPDEDASQRALGPATRIRAR